MSEKINFEQINSELTILTDSELRKLQSTINELLEERYKKLRVKIKKYTKIGDEIEIIGGIKSKTGTPLKGTFTVLKIGGKYIHCKSNDKSELRWRIPIEFIIHPKMKFELI